MHRKFTFYHNYNEASTQKMFKVEAFMIRTIKKNLVFVGLIDKLNVRDFFRQTCFVLVKKAFEIP